MAQVLTLQILDSFKACYKRLPREIQQRVDKALHLLQENPHHPSLRTKKMKGPGDTWEARVSQNYRLTFNWVSDVVILRRVGTHDILKKETR